MHPSIAKLLAAFASFPGLTSLNIATHGDKRLVGLNTDSDAAVDRLAVALGLHTPQWMSDRDHRWLSSNHYGADITIWLTGPMHAVASKEAA